MADIPEAAGSSRTTASNSIIARRDFFKVAGALGAGTALAANSQTLAPPAVATNQISAALPGEMPMRKLGRADAQISALGCGGHHLGDFENVDDAIELVHKAVDGGVTFFDNCWEYWNGKAEDILGRALRGRRDKVFLMTKVCTHGRGGRLAMEMLEASLRRLQTDHLDLWQIHGMVYDNDPALAYAKGGVVEALEEARRQGKTRFVGFTGHKDPAIHLRMMELGFPFDTVQMPLNPFDASFFSFENTVLPEANRRGIAVLGMKSMCGTADPVKKGVVQATELLRYAMSLPVATTISGMDSLEVLQENLRVARNFQPMSATEMAELRRRCAEPAADGRFEPYKVSLKFDNPMTRLPHGFPIDKEQKEVKDMFKKANGGWEPIGL
jgi:diketogulonate reductase-like aldo/keto reductase